MPYRNGQIVKWKVKVKDLRIAIRSVDYSDKNAKKLGKIIYKILSSGLYYKYFKDFEEVQGWDLEDFAYVQSTEDLNGMLAELYDYCDEALIWIE